MGQASLVVLSRENHRDSRQNQITAAQVSPACNGGVFTEAHLRCDRLNHPVLQSR
jgi:hypothetical protein